MGQDRKVYLCDIDIESSGKLALSVPCGVDVDHFIMQYLFVYGLFSDSVFMQCSANQKIPEVHYAYNHLQEAFLRNEEHVSTPKFSFLIDKEKEYAQYHEERLEFLDGKPDGNAEKKAYSQSCGNGRSAAKKLDRDLRSIEVPRRQVDIPKYFRKELLELVTSGEMLKHGVSEEAIRLLMKIISDREEIQTFEVMENFQKHNSNAYEQKVIYRSMRKEYYLANAKAGGARTTLESNSIYNPFYWSRLKKFSDAIGLDCITKDMRKLTTRNFFKIIKMESFVKLKKIYFDAQSIEDYEKIIFDIEKVSALNFLEKNASRIRRMIFHLIQFFNPQFKVATSIFGDAFPEAESYLQKLYLCLYEFKKSVSLLS